MVGDTVMDAVGREPVDRLTFILGVALDRVADASKVIVSIGLVLLRHDADESERAQLPHRHDDGEAVGAEADVDAVLGGRPASLDIGDIEGLRVGAAREAELHPVAHGAVGAVAAAEIGGPEGLVGAVPAQ